MALLPFKIDRILIRMSNLKILKEKNCYIGTCSMGKDLIEPFDPYADPDKTSLQWLTWERNFQLYLESKDVASEPRKLAKLLFCAGIEVQRVYEHAKRNKEEEIINDDNDEWDVQTNPHREETRIVPEKLSPDCPKLS